MSGLTNPAQWLLTALGVSNSGGSVQVNAESALKSAGIWYGINKISGNIGTLPTELKQLLPNGQRISGMDHRHYDLFSVEPCSFQGPLTFKQTVSHHAIMWGNGRAYINERDNELLQVMPDRTVSGLVKETDKSGRSRIRKWHATYPLMNASKVHCVEDLIAEMEGDKDNVVMIPDEQMLHIQGFGHGVSGLSLFEVAQYSLETGLGADKRSAKQMQKGFAGKIAITAPQGVLRDEQKAKEFMETMRREHSANDKAEELMLLREGLTAEVLSMSNRDAEFVQQRLFARQEAALWLMLESILGDDSSVSYNSEEQKQLAYYKNCLMTWLVRWEQELNRKLLTKKDRQNGYYFDFDVSELLRPDWPTMVDTLCKGIAHELFSPNVALSKLGMNPRTDPGGDMYRNPNTTSHTEDETEVATSEGTGQKSTTTSGSTSRQSSRQLTGPEAVQKVYLGVGKVLTSDEARALVNDEAGTNLPIPGPEFSASPARGFDANAMASRFRLMMNREQQKVQSFLDRNDSFEHIDHWYDNNWVHKLADVVAEFGGDSQIAQNHCVRSLNVIKTRPKTFKLDGSEELIIQEIKDANSQ